MRSRPSSTRAKPDIDSGKVRLHHALAEAGVASRRTCEELIRLGRVQVNGKRVERLPAFVDVAEDRVTVDGKVIALGRVGHGAPADARKTYVMVYKPPRVLTSNSDRENETMDGAQARLTVGDMVRLPDASRLFPVGRLEFHASGLVLMTNDGELAHRLTHASFGVPRTFRVWLRGTMDIPAVERLGHVLNVMLIKAAKRAHLTIKQDEPQIEVRMARVYETSGPVGEVDQHSGRRQGGQKTVIDVVLRGGRLIKLPAMLTYAGCKVARLMQIAIGPLTLKGLSSGHWRPLTSGEINALKRASRGGGSTPVAEPARPTRRVRGGSAPIITTTKGSAGGSSSPATTSVGGAVQPPHKPAPVKRGVIAASVPARRAASKPSQAPWTDAPPMRAAPSRPITAVPAGALIKRFGSAKNAKPASSESKP